MRVLLLALFAGATSVAAETPLPPSSAPQSPLWTEVRALNDSMQTAFNRRR
jgi:hypothetical protein